MIYVVVVEMKKSRKKKVTGKGRETRKMVVNGLKNISYQEMRSDYEALKNISCGDINTVGKVGNTVMDYYFFKLRLATKTKRGISYFDWIKTDWMKNESEKRFYEFNIKIGKTPEKARYSVFRLYYGAVHGFKPVIAKMMYCTYKPRIGVLDFSAGWGGRCLGAMALGIPYIGVDSNISLRGAYETMVKDIGSNSSQVTMKFQDAVEVDYSKFKYDMVLTSPPYFKKTKAVESYPHMPVYKDGEDYNKRFLFPVICKTFKNLAKGGVYALNVPQPMFENIKRAGILPGLYTKHVMYVQSRFAKGNPKNTHKKYEEYIYVWKKN